jgi:hypothetical protein
MLSSIRYRMENDHQAMLEAISGRENDQQDHALTHPAEEKMITRIMLSAIR